MDNKTENKKDEIYGDSHKLRCDISHNDVWDDAKDFVDPTLVYDEKTGDYYQKKEIEKPKEIEIEKPKPTPTYTEKEPNSKKNKQKHQPKSQVKLNEYDDEDYDYDYNDDDEETQKYYKK